MATVIFNEKLEKAWNRNSFNAKLKKTAETIRKINNGENVNKNDYDNMNSFLAYMDKAENIVKNHPDTVSSYIEAKQFLFGKQITPEQAQFGIFGVIKQRLAAENQELWDNRYRYSLEEDEAACEKFNINFEKMHRLDTITDIGYIPKITKIISNDSNTIVEFIDGTQTKVCCEKNDSFDFKTGIYLAILKKAMGNDNLAALLTILEDAELAEMAKRETDADIAAEKHNQEEIIITDEDTDPDSWYADDENADFSNSCRNDKNESDSEDTDAENSSEKTSKVNLAKTTQKSANKKKKAEKKSAPKTRKKTSDK